MKNETMRSETQTHKKENNMSINSSQQAINQAQSDANKSASGYTPRNQFGNADAWNRYNAELNRQRGK